VGAAQVHHVNLVVGHGQGDEVAAFYRDVFDLVPAERPPTASRGGAWLTFGDGRQLHLSERDGAAHPDAHVALVVDDIAALRRPMADAGAPWADGDDLFGGGRGFTRDPAGNRIEVLERAGLLAQH
jgi:catechol 2,3-dioxygenase-like lactoylglutathione lyase family enzyme